MSENSEPKGLPLPEVKEGQFVQTRKDKKQRNRLRFRAEMFGTRKLVGHIKDHPQTMLPRIETRRGIANESMLEKILGSIVDAQGNRLFPVPVIPLRDARQQRDERGRKLPFPEAIVEAGHHIKDSYPDIGNRVLVGSKWLYDEGAFPLIYCTFPKAIDCMAYVRGLGAPANAIFKDVDFTLTNILGGTDPFTGKQFAAGSDGSGRIHPSHYFFSQIGSVCIIQIRIWIPLLGGFWKGILVPDERCIDDDGNPTIYLDWGQGKGRHKATFKACLGSSNGSFDSNGVVIKPNQLIDVRSKDLTQFLSEQGSLPAWQEEMVNRQGTGSTHVSIMQDWSRHGKVKHCFQNYGMVEMNSTTLKICSSLIVDSFDRLAEKGGMNAFLDEVCEENEKPRFIRMLCDRLGLNPLRVPEVLGMVHKAIQRKLHHISQGCGQFADRYVLVMDHSVPEGHVVMGHRHNPDNPKHPRYSHGMEIALTRLPIVTSQALLTLRVVNLEDGGKRKKELVIDGNKYSRENLMERLGHLLLKTDKGLKHEKCQAVLNPKDVAKIFGDDDGDFVMINDDPRIVELYKHRIPIWADNPDARFLFEPVPIEDGVKSSVPTVNDDGKMSEEAKNIIGLNGQGPVGVFTIVMFVFWARQMFAHALATADLLQTAIDLQKKDVVYNDPRKTIHRNFWKHLGNNEWKPVGCELPLDSEWYDDKGIFNMKTFMGWAYGEIKKHLKRNYPGFDGGVTLEDMLQWRPRTGEPKKRINPKLWKGMVNPPVDGGNLVDFIFQYSQLMWEKFEQSYSWSLDDSNVSLVDVLPKALGIKVFPMNYTGKDYRSLLGKSGLSDYGKFLKQLMNQQDTAESLASEEDSIRWREMKNLKVEAEYQLLCHKLRECSVPELVTIWVTELTQADAIARRDQGARGTRSPDQSINRAFRAIAFPGSPVLKLLGMDLPEPCSYLKGEELEKHFKLLNQMVDRGQCSDIFHLGPFGRLINDRHEQITGIPYHECKDCNKLMEDRVVSAARHNNEHGDKMLSLIGRKLASGMNQFLQNR
tara:strand:- start:1031 stop:4144 length:3114 start_codon:yes stop_codon:yes gene_type:complete